MALQAQFEKASGQERLNLMNELRGMKGEAARCEGELRRLQPPKVAETAPPPPDPELSSLEAELAKVREALQQP